MSPPIYCMTIMRMCLTRPGTCGLPSRPARHSGISLPSRVRFIAQGLEFDNAAWEGTGHVDVDFGLDTPFLHEELQLTSEAEQRVRANVARLVDFTNKIDQNCGTNGRLLWSDSETDNLAQKLIARLQKVQ